MYKWTDGTELYHHGIKGQTWGVRNGPPYPLNSDVHDKVSGNKKMASDLAERIRKNHANKGYMPNVVYPRQSQELFRKNYGERVAPIEYIQSIEFTKKSTVSAEDILKVAKQLNDFQYSDEKMFKEYANIEGFRKYLNSKDALLDFKKNVNLNYVNLILNPRNHSEANFVFTADTRSKYFNELMDAPVEINVDLDTNKIVYSTWV